MKASIRQSIAMARLLGVAVPMISAAHVIAAQAEDPETPHCLSEELAAGSTMHALCKQAAILGKTKQGVPSSPAFAVLNLTPEVVARPKTPEELALSVLDSVDAAGNSQRGLALEFVPYTVFAGKSATLSKYQSSWWSRQLSNTQVSLAFADGQDDADKSARAAVGIHLTPWLRNDPRMNNLYIECLAEKAVGVLGMPLPNEDADAFNEAQRKKLVASATPCRSSFEAKHWNDEAWTVGVSPAWKSLSGDARDLDYDGIAVWSSLAFKPGPMRENNAGNLVAHVKYRADELIPASDGGSDDDARRDSLALAGRYEFGRADFNGTAEAAYIENYVESGDDESYLQFSAGVNYQVMNSDFWLRASIARTDGRSIDDETLFGLSLAWGSNEFPLF